MKMVQITPGSGDNFYCENCLRDSTLVKALRAAGQDVLMMPLYLPLSRDIHGNVTNTPLFFGGINVYLQQKLKVFQKTPRWLDRLFDAPRLLIWAGHRAGMTRPSDLGATTLSMLQGQAGHQSKELERLVHWLTRPENTPDIICISNLLLAGLVPRLQDQLDCSVVVLLQDEDAFLDSLPEPYRSSSWDLVRQHASRMDGLLAVSHAYARTMAQRLGLPLDRIKVIPMGIDLDDTPSHSADPTYPTLGFWSRMCEDKGLDVLVDAFIELKQRPQHQDLRLAVGGGYLEPDRPYIEKQQAKLSRQGCAEHVTFCWDLDPTARQDFLRGISVMAVPERQPVAYGLYVLEALALGIPFVQPAFGVFPELLEATGAGVLYESVTVSSLVQALETLLTDPDHIRSLGQAGHMAVRQRYHVHQTAAAMVTWLKEVRQLS